MSLDELTNGKEKIAARVAKVEAGFINIAIDRVVEYFKNSDTIQVMLGLRYYA